LFVLNLLNTGRGTVLTGKLERGVIKKGDEAVIMGHGRQFKTTVTGMYTNGLMSNSLHGKENYSTVALIPWMSGMV